MKATFELIHEGDHSAHLIEQLTSLSEGEIILDHEPLTTVERVWSDFTFVKRSHSKHDNTLRISVHIDSEWKVTSHKKVIDWETWHVLIDE